MKVNANIYCVHSASFQSLVKDSPEFTQGGRRLLHNIKAGLIYEIPPPVSNMKSPSLPRTFARTVIIAVPPGWAPDGKQREADFGLTRAQV
jgi:hypothetical protein